MSSKNYSERKARIEEQIGKMRVRVEHGEVKVEGGPPEYRGLGEREIRAAATIRHKGRHHYAAHLDDMTVAVWSPFLKRVVYITPRQYRLIAAVMAGWQGTQRQLAALTNYTLGGVNDALRSMRRLGLLVVRRVRGRLGSTFARLRRGVHVTNDTARNVREHTSKSYIRSQSDPETSPREYANISGVVNRLAALMALASPNSRRKDA